MSIREMLMLSGIQFGYCKFREVLRIVFNSYHLLLAPGYSSSLHITVSDVDRWVA